MSGVNGVGPGQAVQGGGAEPPNAELFQQKAAAAKDAGGIQSEAEMANEMMGSLMTGMLQQMMNNSKSDTDE